MKTKLTFLVLAIGTLLGVGMLMALKQDNVKQYILVRTIEQRNIKLFIYKDGSVTEYEAVWDKGGGAGSLYKNYWNIITTHVINEGYKLKHVSATSGSQTDFAGREYVFEKE